MKCYTRKKRTYEYILYNYALRRKCHAFRMAVDTITRFVLDHDLTVLRESCCSSRHIETDPGEL